MGSKHIITDVSLPDRISDLPSDIISFILDRLSIRDAVTTSILSKDWRHKWIRIRNLIFDDEFADDVIDPRIQGDSGDREMIICEYGNIIGSILLHHIGPIQKFVLEIPYDCVYTLPSDLLGSWMLFISQNEVKELTIEAPCTDISLPAYLFHSNELQHLKLDVHTLEIHPHDFSGFCNLICLDLSANFIDEDEISNLISKCPLLETLSLTLRCLMHPFVIDAPRLHFLNACFDFDNNVFLTLKNVRNVTDISLHFDRCDVDFCYLISIFGSLPKVETVILYLPHKLDMPPDAPMSLPITLHNHKSLTLLHVDISSLECIHFVLCVLKSSPNLQTLNLEILPSDTSEDEDAVHLLDMHIRGEIQTNETMKSLLTVKIKGLFRSKIDVMLIKLILSFSPVLKTMYLNGKDTRDSWLGEDILNEAEFTLMAELLQCPRSSCQAQVIYSRYPGDSSIFDFSSL